MGEGHVFFLLDSWCLVIMVSRFPGTFFCAKAEATIIRDLLHNTASRGVVSLYRCLRAQSWMTVKLKAHVASLIMLSSPSCVKVS